MPEKRILLFYISEKSGHHHASLAIEHAINCLESSAKVLTINSFNYTNPLLERFVNRAYMNVIKNTPRVWDYLYDNQKVFRKIQRLRDAIHRFNSSKLKDLIDEFKPDVIGCTQAFPCGMIADLKRFHNYTFSLFAILTDFSPHVYWICDAVDTYIVAARPAKEYLQKYGIQPDRINILGIPIDPKFKQKEDTDITFKELGFDRNVPVILIMGGGQGLGPIGKIVTMLDNIDLDFQIIIITGINERLFSYLDKRRLYFKKKTAILSYVTNINRLMDISNLLITKAGGLTVAEALSKGVPMIIINPIPGQEEKNTNFLLENKVALKAKDERDLGLLVRDLLCNPEKLNSMRNAAFGLGNINSAIDIAKLMLEKCQMKA